MSLPTAIDQLNKTIQLEIILRQHKITDFADNNYNKYPLYKDYIYGDATLDSTHQRITQTVNKRKRQLKIKKLMSNKKLTGTPDYYEKYINEIITLEAAIELMDAAVIINNKTSQAELLLKRVSTNSFVMRKLREHDAYQTFIHTDNVSGDTLLTTLTKYKFDSGLSLVNSYAERANEELFNFISSDATSITLKNYDGYERKDIHEVCTDIGLAHHSVGGCYSRALIVEKPIGWTFKR